VKHRLDHRRSALLWIEEPRRKTNGRPKGPEEGAIVGVRRRGEPYPSVSMLPPPKKKKGGSVRNDREKQGEKILGKGGQLGEKVMALSQK